MSFLVVLPTLLAAAAAAGAVVFLAKKVRQHRRLLDRRIDILADESYRRGHGLDLRLDALERTLRDSERLRRVDHLLALTGAAEHTGKLGADAAGRLTRSLLDLHDDVVAAAAAQAAASAEASAAIPESG